MNLETTKSYTDFDHQMMSRAIALAKKGMFTTAPNPNVGCVIVRHGEVVGEGYHYRAGEPHAEIYALRAAKEKARGATVYVTLEPCSHFGRTPPCAEALVKAGVAKVICAMQDPNPQVAGRGIQILKQAGIEVQSGLLENDSMALNPAFIKQMKTGMPYVQLKLAASLDGQTALSNGDSQWITSSQARRDVQYFRAKAGAILSTSKTVIDDNASLNVRWHDLPEPIQQDYPKIQIRQPVRVILDRKLNLTEDLKLYQVPGEVIRVSDNSLAEMVVGLDSDGHLDLKQTLQQLSSRYNINHIWVEAGATLASAFIKQNLVDELIFYLAPKLMGADSRGLIKQLGLERMDQVIDLEIKNITMIGCDIRIISKIIEKN